jgi:hypothetical protein
MPVPMLRAAEERPHPADVIEPIKCALVAKPKHQNVLLRIFLVVIALLAVALLIVIALYYTQSNSATVKHANSFRSLSLRGRGGSA